MMYDLKRRTWPRAICAAAIIALSFARAQAGMTTDDVLKKLKPEQVEARLPSEHPAMYLMFAGRYYKAGDLNRALFWFYEGQLREKIFLATATPAERSQVAGLFGAISAGLGKPLTRYSCLNPDLWIGVISDVLDWDKTHENGITSKTKFATAYARQRAALAKLPDYINAHREDLAAKARATPEGVGP